MTVDTKASGASEARAIDTEASLLMKRGIRLLSDAHPDTVSEALACFDAALALRSRLPIDEVPVFRYGLAACWLNRADALVRLGGATQISLALGAYDAGVALLRVLPLDEDPRFPRRLAMALQNRGLVLQSQGGAPAAEAITAFTAAIAVLEHDHAALIPDRQYLMATVWMNLANARASEAAAESLPLARQAALRAIALVAEAQENDADAAEVGLKARHVLCQALSAPLSLARARDQTMPDDVHEATDAVDDGLGLARRWEQKGVVRFRPLAYDLFRFGTRVFAIYQPQFLNEFIVENMDPRHSSAAYVESAEMRSAAQEALGLSTAGR
jgi:hypothetical protein